MRRPGPRDRLAGDLQVVDELRPGPDRGAFPGRVGLGGVLDQLVQARVAVAVAIGLDSHAWHAAPVLTRPQHPNKHSLNQGAAGGGELRRWEGAPGGYLRGGRRIRKCLSSGRLAQLQMVTYTGGLKRDGGTPAAGDRMTCMASGVDRKRRSPLAAVLRWSRSRVVACQTASAGTPAMSTRASSPRRTWWETRCSIAVATPAPSAAADQAADWLGSTRMLPSGMPSRASSRDVA